MARQKSKMLFQTCSPSTSTGDTEIEEIGKYTPEISEKIASEVKKFMRV